MGNNSKHECIFQQTSDGTWWYVWSGYSIGPWETEERAIDEFNKTKAKLDCSTGSCEDLDQ